MKVVDPLWMAEKCWPWITFYDKQREIIYSVKDNDETIVPAGNMLGKDFVSAFIVLWFFLSRKHCRVITTSADYNQLEAVLWGEIRRLLQTTEQRLPLVTNHLHLRKIVDGEVDGLSYVIGRVAAKGEGMLGHHIARTNSRDAFTMFLSDEASSMDDSTYEAASTWAHRKLIIGNPYPCNNYFKRGTKEGDLPRPKGNGYIRKVIQIKASQSPNVRYGEAEKRAGREPSGEMIIPGVMGYDDYYLRRTLWDEMRQCIGLDAEFWEGADSLLFPPSWLDRAERYYVSYLQGKPRTARAIGIDPAEGGDKTSMCALDEFGIIELVSKKTPDTSKITGEALAFMRKWNVPPDKVCFDRGGGGKEHADRLRAQGYPVRTVAFGESVVPEPRRGVTPLERKKGEKEEAYRFKNRRAEMYGRLRVLLDPGAAEYSGNPDRCFGLIPAVNGEPYKTLREELAPIPLTYDEEGRLYLLPKQKKLSSATRSKDGGPSSLTELIGHSPDNADALVIGLHILHAKPIRRTAGVF